MRNGAKNEVTLRSRLAGSELAPMLERERSPEAGQANLASPPLNSRLVTVALIVVIGAGTTGFLFFARPVLLPIVLAWVLGMVLNPLVRWLNWCRLPMPLGAGLVLGVAVSGVALGFVQLGRPALAWANDAPVHIAQLRHRLQAVLRPAASIHEAAVAVGTLGATAESDKPAVEVKDHQMDSSIRNWTSNFAVGLVETLALLYLLLASGDLFLKKFVGLMPTFRDKRRAVEISGEIRQQISSYLFSVSVINLGVGTAVALGLFILGVPNPAMWGMLAAILNFVPYFGPVAGVVLLGVAGILSFDTLGRGLLAPAWYLVLHLVEANLVTPAILGRRLTLNPVLIFVSLIVWTWLWGVPGALLSVPILMSIRVVCESMPALAPVSEFLGGGGGSE